MSTISPEQALLLLIALPTLAALVSLPLGRASYRGLIVLTLLSLLANLALALQVAAAGLARPVVLGLVDASAGPLAIALPLAAGRPAVVALVGVAVVCLVVSVFSAEYVRRSRFVGGYYALLLLSAAALNATLLAGNLLALAAALAWLGAALAALVGLDFAGRAGAAATKVLLVFLAGAALVGVASWAIVGRGGSTDLDGLLARSATALGDWLPLVGGLLIVPLAIAAGLAPAHTWLTSATRVALPPVAGLLVGGVLPAGLLVGLRILRPDAESIQWPALALLGGLSLAVAGLGALRTPDLLPSLGFQAVGQAGLAAIALSWGTGEGQALALYQLASLTLFVPLALLGAAAVLRPSRSGALSHFTHRRAHRPLAAGAALVGVAGVAGLPPFPGYWARVSVVDALFAPGPYHLTLLALVLVGSALLTTALLRLFRVEEPAAYPEAPPARSGIDLSLVGLAALGAVAAFARPDLCRELLGVAPAAAAPSTALAATLVAAALGTGLALRLGELRLLPPGLQAGFDGAARQLARAASPLDRVRKRIAPEWLDPYAVVAGVLVLAARAAGLLLDNTVGRLGRSA